MLRDDNRLPVINEKLMFELFYFHFLLLPALFGHRCPGERQYPLYDTQKTPGGF